MTGQNASTNPFEFWKDMAQKWSDAVGQAGAGSAPFTPPPIFNPFQTPTPSQGYDPAQFWSQLGQQYMKACSDWWAQNGAGAPTEEMFRNAERQWTSQLEQTSQAFSQTMASEAFSSMLGKFIEQGLTWQEKITTAAQPQVDAAYRGLNLPSRDQMDRLFERVIGLEERLDDLEDGHQLLKQVAKRLDEIEERTQEILSKVANSDGSSSRGSSRGRSRAGSSEPTDEVAGKG